MAQPISLNSPTPCEDLFPNAPQWDGPKYHRICTDSIPDLNQQGFKKCCYWIVYHDRVRITTSPKPGGGVNTCYFYEVNVTSIVYEGEDCKKRTKGEIINAFHESIFKLESISHPNYFTKCGDPTNIQNNTMLFYSTGGCYEMDAGGEIIYDELGYPIPCDPSINFCCQYSKQVHVENSVVVDIDTIIGSNSYPITYVYDSTQSHCINPCQKSCDEVLTIPYIELSCNTPCNTGVWTSKPPKEFTIPGCPDCKVKVYYANRPTNPCLEIGMNNYHDLRLDLIEADSISCSNCTLSMQAIHSFVVDELIKTGFDSYPQNNTMNPYYRVFYSSCWTDFYSEGCCPDSNGVFNFPTERVIKPCRGDLCCIKKYTIATDDNGNRTYILNEVIIPETNNCPIDIYPCVFMCGDDE